MARIDDFTIDEKITYVKSVSEIVNTYQKRLISLKISDISTELTINTDIGDIEISLYKDGNAIIQIGDMSDCRDWESYKIKVKYASFFDDWIY